VRQPGLKSIGQGLRLPSRVSSVSGGQAGGQPGRPPQEGKASIHSTSLGFVDFE
jgi:hypothetical protein